MKRLLTSSAASFFMVALYWLAGFDFTSRGVPVALCFFLSVFAFVWVYFAPWWEHEL